jgi:hypothetical protein
MATPFFKFVGAETTVGHFRFSIQCASFLVQKPESYLGFKEKVEVNISGCEKIYG